QIPDMHGNQPGAGTGGRSVCAAPFDGRELGSLIRKMRQPLPEIAFFGMGIASGADLKHFLNVTRSTSSLFHVGRRLAKHMADLAVHRRGMHLSTATRSWRAWPNRRRTSGWRSGSPRPP